MQINDIIKSANYIDTVNKIDNLINELLYSQEIGYINMTPEEAVQNAQSIIDKFNYESDKIIKESNLSNCSDLIKNKKDELIKTVKNQYEKQAVLWAREVFNHSIDNLILKLAVNKNNPDDTEKVYCEIHYLINWLTEAEKLTQEEKNALLNEINSSVQNVLNTPDENYIQNDSPLVSDENLFMEFFNLISSDINSFLAIDFNNYKLRLTNSDIAYFQTLKNRLNINKTEVIDEINLENYALKLLNLKTNSEKYEFIKEIIDDFSLNKNSKPEDKIPVVKRRLELFKNKESYFSKLLS